MKNLPCGTNKAQRRPCPGGRRAPSPCWNPPSLPGLWAGRVLHAPHGYLPCRLLDTRPSSISSFGICEHGSMPRYRFFLGGQLKQGPARRTGARASWTLPHPRISSTEPPLPVTYVETSDTSVAGRRCTGVLTVAAKAGL